MKIVIVNKTDAQGGAAIAAKRLKEALSKNGEEPVMLVQKKHTQDENTFTTKKGLAAKYFEFALFVIERLYFYFSEKSKAVRFAFSPAVSGENITRNQWIRNADIIHIHWFNQGFLSLKNVKQILKLNKPVVWTLHDMWAFTGGCHYSGTCENYRQYCGNCSFVKHPGNQDLSSKIWKRKEKIFKKANIRIVTCSEWLAQKARQSSLLQRFTISSIPNPIDTDLYFPKSKADIRNKLNLPLNKKLILFGSANIMDQRKGLNYLLQALQKLKDENALTAENIEIVLFGKSDADFISQIPFNVYDMGMIKGDLNINDI